ncbi:3-dehydroquinate synthase [Corynebacterium striatum]|uniref:3-dehydroquinate synthase n=1 Tax=Corynebacterium striatum TaxID=43770 RepID=A0AAQ1TW24_CORST|nr:3-dehydroquinate synthase [Corynebacterium striatum]EEI78435.1 3-dehydroquinate synthase [Corynebacterium striatum ATCC 6940]QQE53610.1 3-dehydroquinate synthase [Corynebacterium striatum]GEA43691.1 3-dehydroquinate synthase [Corynebacterium striatum]STD62188.1 3-dehydroquinate synthase [Corynebacterium striatum]
MTTIPVNGPNPYEVTVGTGLTADIADRVKSTGAGHVGIVFQPPLAAAARQLAAEAEARNVVVTLLPIPDAEASKRLEVLGGLWDELGAANFSRRDVIVGLGGGATTDLAGFLAATWMRGIKVIQVPTTLLAMVDAAVGGKTGINTDAGKNLVGAFHEPDSVFVDLDRLVTLPEEEIVAGSAEIIKTGFIHDPVIIERYLADPAACLNPLQTLPGLIERSIAVKARVVGEDLKEAGLRETLNYGHTFGHAVELRENYTWRHGRAVAVGMMFIAQLSHTRGLIDAALLQTHSDILASVGLPTTYEAGHFDELYAGMTHDKKNRGGHIRFVALTGIGQTTRIEDATIEEMQAAYAAISRESRYK